MSSVNVVIGGTTDVNLPTGLTFSAYKYDIVDSTGAAVQTANDTALSHMFADVTLAPGAYTANVSALDQNSAVLGTPASAAFTIAAAPTFAQPASVTVTVS